MRFMVTALAMACAPYVVAQTAAVATPAPSPAASAPAQRPSAAPRAPFQKGRFRTAPGLGATAAAPGSARAAKPVALPPNSPVVTLEGVCKTPQAKSACKTVVTRAELDAYVNAFAPDVAETARGRMAVQYARTVAYASLAEQEGLDKDPVLAKEIEDQVRLTRLRILSNAFLKKAEGPAALPLGPEVQKFYDAHRDQYEDVQVYRLSVPLLAPTDDGKRLERAAVKKEMEEIRRRALDGEDLGELQQEAFKGLHIQATPPPVNLVTMRRGSVQGDEAKAFDMKPGEISDVIEAPAAFVVLKVDSKGVLPIEAVRQEIEGILRRNRTQTGMGRLTKGISAQFNLQYLGLSSQPDLFGTGETTRTTANSEAKTAVKAAPPQRP